MNSTFMFNEDRFGPADDFPATYHHLGGRALTPFAVERAIRAAFSFLDARYGDPGYQDDFPSLAEAFAATAPELPQTERELLEATFAAHELGTVPAECVETLRALSARHELRLLTNIWARKDTWLEYLSRIGVLPLFRRTVFSSDTRSVKPSARLLEAVLEGVAWSRREVLMVGDSLARDLRPARRGGLTTLMVSAAVIPAHARDCVDYQVSSITALTEEFRSPAG